MNIALEQRRPKGKKRRRHDIITSQLQLYKDIKRTNLQGVLLDAAVWLCAEDDTVQKLDYLCLGNLDGGSSTAVHVHGLLTAAGNKSLGTKAVRLSIDEAFFMAYALNALQVYDVIDGAAVCLNTGQLWQRLQQVRQDFVTLYLAYHHFRSKGWIPRTGLQYGVDFVLYQRHPALAHSDYSVIIQPVGQTPLSRPTLGWHDLQITNRLTTQVGKRLMLLYIYARGNLDKTNPNCLHAFEVQERCVRRWVPEAQRAK